MIHIVLVVIPEQRMPSAASSAHQRGATDIVGCKTGSEQHELGWSEEVHRTMKTQDD